MEWILQLGDDLDLHQDVLGKRLDCHAGASRLANEILTVNAVECGKIAHIGKETGGLINPGKGRGMTDDIC